MASKSLHLPPFPELFWSDGVWEGDTQLPSWKGFQSRRGAYCSVSDENVSDGGVRLYVTSPIVGKPLSPTKEEANAFQWLLQNEKRAAAALLKAIFAEYPKLQREYGYRGKEAEEYMPPIKESKDLMPLVGLSNVHVLNVAMDDVAYIGYEFGCTWDPEHGLGIMTHMSRVVEIGGADTSFLGWIARKDAEAGDESEE